MGTRPVDSGAPPPPIDVSPSAWTPPFMLSEGMWRNSGQPICNKAGRSRNYVDSVWSDARGVYVLMSVHDSFASMVGRMWIYFNDGSGWKIIHEEPEPFPGKITGFPGGGVLLQRARGRSSPSMTSCGLKRIDKGRADCEIPGAVTDVHVAGPQTAYAIRNDRVLKYSGGQWTQLGQPLGDGSGSFVPEAIWGDQNTVVVIGASGVYLGRADTGAFVLQAGAPQGASAVFGFGPTDIWVGTGSGEVWQFDGTQWKAVISSSTPSAMCKRTVQDLWGADGKLFVLGRQHLLTLEMGSMTELASWCEVGVRLTSIWGNSSQEVFMGVRDTGEIQCSSQFLIWYNGSQLSRL